MVKRIGKYELGKTLGRGTFSKVKLGTDTTDPRNATYAIKIVDRSQVVKENMEQQLKSEIAIMKILKHENIIQLIEVLQTHKHIYIVLELVTGGELFDRIVSAKRFDEAVARRYFQQLILGVYYCHQQGIAHRDLKPENLLVDAGDVLKISDFGLSAISQERGKDKLLMTTCGTPNYVAPEVLKEQGYNGFIADVWSCGVILFVMLAGYLPFDDPTMNGLFNKIERGDFRMPKHLGPETRKLISQMLVVDPKERITLDKILENPWFLEQLPAEKLQQAKNSARITAPPPEAIEVIPTLDEEDGGEQEKTKLDPQALTAFQLASMLIMGSLSPLVTDGKVEIRCYTRFFADGSKTAVQQRIVDLCSKYKADPKLKDNGSRIAGFINTRRGLVTFSINLFATVCYDLTIVEVRRGRGDTLEFQDFYRKLVGELKDIVPQQPSPAEQ